MEERKKRGCNYTMAEKDILLGLVKKYQNIIENKETNATMILKKREVWDSVCQQYNAVAASGFRSWQQLRHLYENLKQRSKKNVAKRLQYYDKTKDVKDVKLKASVDKKEINRTGGGSYRSTLTDHDAQILAMVAPQIQPIPNPYDDAALYFGETDINNKYESEETVDTNDQVVIIENITMAESSKPCTVTSNPADNREVTMTTTNTMSYQKPTTTALKLTDRVKSKHKKNKYESEVTASYNTTSNQTVDISDQVVVTASFDTTSNQTVDINDQVVIMEGITMAESSRPCTVTSNPADRVKPKQKKPNTKEQYFKAKLRNARLENKHLINKNKMEINKYKIEMQILKLRLIKLQSSKKH